MNSTEQIALGCVGGALPDLLRIIGMRYEPAPDYLARRVFWISLVLLVILGGASSYLVGAHSAIEALALGYTAPSAITKLLGKSPVGPEAAYPTRDSGPALQFQLRPTLPRLIGRRFEELRSWWAN